MGAEQAGDLHDLATVGGVGTDLDQREFAGHRARRVLLDDLDDVDQLVELLGHLLEREVLDGHDDGHPRQSVRLRGPDRQGLDVEAPAGEERGHAREHARLVLHQDAQGVGASGHLSSSWPAVTAASTRSVASWISVGSSAAESLSSNSGRMSRAAMISSLDVPAATIGHTWASLPTMKSMSTGRSLISRARAITSSTSSARSHRNATQPSASASLTKSGMCRECVETPRGELRSS